ncbi:MAG: sensor histidine kinase [Crocinitomicaceae bacterium TMED114]|nr:MAG: sensor histidine kinase [Crocinitomicaceae bacterium TMED114]
MLAVTALGIFLVAAATLIGFSRLDAEYNSGRLVRKEAAVAKSLGFALRGVVGETVEATSLSWTVMPGDFADRIVEIEAVQGLPLAVYRLDGSLFVTSSVESPSLTGFPTEVDPEVLIALAQGAGRLEVPVGDGDYLAYWYQVNEAERPVALVALRYEARSLEGDSRDAFLWSLAGVFGLVFVVAVGLALLLTQSITRPLERLGALMERMDVSREERVEPLRFEASGSGEIATLVERYNRMAEKARASALALAQTERESAWREMAMQVAHEIKNPLTPMKLGIQQLERRAMDEAQEAEALRSQIVDLSATLQGQIDLLVRIADEFSTLARLPQGEVARVSLRSVLESVVSLHQRAGQDLVLEMASDAAIEADEDQLRRMLGNLILNAQQAVEEKGSRVVVRATEQMIEVEDDGPGMPQEVAERAFEPQFTTRGSGSGLGLAIVKAICDRHGWRVEFESISVTGTAFRILFDA